MFRSLALAHTPLRRSLGSPPPHGTATAHARDAGAGWARRARRRRCCTYFVLGTAGGAVDVAGVDFSLPPRLFRARVAKGCACARNVGARCVARMCACGAREIRDRVRSRGRRAVSPGVDARRRSIRKRRLPQLVESVTAYTARAPRYATGCEAARNVCGNQTSSRCASGAITHSFARSWEC